MTEDFQEKIGKLRLEIFRIYAMANGITLYANDGSGQILIKDEERLEYIKKLADKALEIAGDLKEKME